ncbi:hypothetical protein [Sphingomonas baiyangensis]|uniref:hypothetical protein n=1 Tax=Sphingomonas baiyangensis TaxID=2572576 RepID=UPI00146F34C6|nr:hypothetical protein [Sphingomonas baiyangensis]
MPGAYDEEFTPEELAAMADNTPPPAAEPEGTDAASAAAATDAPATEPAAPAAPAPAGAQPAPGDPEEDERYRQFAAQYQGRSTDELVRIAYQQQQRANRSAFEQRKATEQRDAVLQRIQQARAARDAAVENVSQRRREFDEQLQNDPDAATRRLAQERFDAEEREAKEAADRVEQEARAEEAFHFASQYIPDLPQRAPLMQQFGVEIGYSPEEVRGISDGRDLVMLHLASVAGNLMKAGVIDRTGQLLRTAPDVQATDPRLTAPPPPNTLSSAPGRSASAAKTAEQQLQDMLNLSDKDFDALSEEDIARIMG